MTIYPMPYGSDLGRGAASPSRNVAGSFAPHPQRIVADVSPTDDTATRSGGPRSTHEPSTTTVWTLGHSTRSTEELLAVLDAYGIELVVDVRRFPGSRRLPQFASDALGASLEAHGIAYRWLESLGGRRRADATSPNTGWRHPAFRAYADHVATDAFAAGLIELLTLAQGLRTAVMCAELLWWRCHRRIIADVLSVLGMEVVHIRDATIAEKHVVGPPGRVVNGRLTYA